MLKHNLRPGLLKVDVEGAEFSVFAGAQQVLSTFRPGVISELWRKSAGAGVHSGADVLKMFEELNYIVLDAHDPVSKLCLHKIGEIICIPRESIRLTMTRATGC